MTTFDQYETESVYSYSGSYGSRVFWPNTTIFTTGVFKRDVFGDTATNYFNSRSILLDGRKFLLSNFNRRGSSFTNRKRFARFFIGMTENEQYFDSVVGHPISYGLANGISFMMTPKGFRYDDDDVYTRMNGARYAESSSAVYFIGTEAAVTISKTDTSEQYCDNIWNNAAPFQSRYKNVYRQKSPSLTVPINGRTNVTHSVLFETGSFKSSVTHSFNNLSVISFVSVSAPPDSVPVAQVVYCDTAFSGVAGSGNTFVISHSSVDNVLAFFSNTIYSTYFSYFGFGDFANKLPGTILGNATISSGVFYNQMNYPIIRGWKYGLISAMPTYTKAVFRYGRFGQPRDLLEQRPYTKFYNSENILDSPIQVTFTSGTQDYIYARDYVTATNPSYDPRDSGFWDYQYRSGFPFVDIDNID